MFREKADIWERLTRGLKPQYLAVYLAHSRAHPEFYREFEKEALQVIRAGEPRGSARRICQDMRWDHRERFGDPVIAYYARVFASKNPQYRGFFAMKGVDVDSACLLPPQRTGELFA